MRTVLLVEDEVKIVRLARDYLERGGFEVLAASNGETALATFRAHRPDLRYSTLVYQTWTAWTCCARCDASRTHR